MLISCLRALVERFDTSFSKSGSVSALLERLVHYLADFTPTILSVEVAFQHLR